MIQKENTKLDEKKIEILLKKYEKTFGHEKKLAKFEEPTLMLIRRNGKVDFYEGIKQGNYTFTHSEGDERDIIINTGKLLTFEYGKQDFRGYIAHEDEFTPYPQEPIIDTETYKISLSKILNDIKTYKEKELRAFQGLIWKIALGTALIMGVYLAYRWLGGGGTTVIKEIITNPPTPETTATVLGSIIAIRRGRK